MQIYIFIPTFVLCITQGLSLLKIQLENSTRLLLYRDESYQKSQRFQTRLSLFSIFCSLFFCSRVAFVSTNCCRRHHFRDVQSRSWESEPIRLDSHVICMRDVRISPEVHVTSASIRRSELFVDTRARSSNPAVSNPL